MRRFGIGLLGVRRIKRWGVKKGWGWKTGGLSEDFNFNNGESERVRFNNMKTMNCWEGGNCSQIGKTTIDQNEKIYHLEPDIRKRDDKQKLRVKQEVPLWKVLNPKVSQRIRGHQSNTGGITRKINQNTKKTTDVRMELWK